MTLRRRNLRPALVLACLGVSACGAASVPVSGSAWQGADGSTVSPTEAARRSGYMPSPPPGGDLTLTGPPLVVRTPKDATVLALPPPKGALDPAPAAAAAAPQPVAAETVPPAPPLQPVRLPPPAETAIGLADDPEARRFLLLRQLEAEGLVGSDDAARRRALNLGSLLPFSSPPPAAGLDKPLPPSEDLINRLHELARGKAPAAIRDAERAFLIEGLLPLRPGPKAPPVRTDPEALRIGRDRVERLAAAGLVSPEERDWERAAIERAEQAVASQPLPPEPPKAPVKKKRPSGADAARAAAAGEVPPGLEKAAASGPAGVHLLSMASENLEGIAWDGLTKQFPELAPLQHKVVKAVIPDLGTTYRLLAGPLPQAEADTLCKALKGKGQSCTVVKY